MTNEILLLITMKFEGLNCNFRFEIVKFHQNSSKVHKIIWKIFSINLFSFLGCEEIVWPWRRFPVDGKTSTKVTSITSDIKFCKKKITKKFKYLRNHRNRSEILFVCMKFFQIRTFLIFLHAKVIRPIIRPKSENVRECDFPGDQMLKSKLWNFWLNFEKIV